MPRRLHAALLFGALAGILSAHPLAAQEQPANQPADRETQEPMKVTEIEGIAEYQLENGVRVLLFPDPSKEVVTVNMTVFVGSRHEGYGEAGMAHLLEHMLFKGTPEHPDVPAALQDRGARFNGTTWLDRTNYYETLPASEENLEFAIRLEADRLVNSFIRGEDLESEMTVVRNEFESGENSPIRVLMQRMDAVAYEWHNYGKSTIGNRSDIERVPVVKLRRFYKKFYRPDNVMVVVAGNFESDNALKLLSEYFGEIPVPDTPIDDTYTVEPPQDGERTVVLRRVGDVQWAGVGYHVPAGNHPDFTAIRVLSLILGDEPSGRLYRQLVETELASNVYTMASGLFEPGLFKAFAQLPENKSIEEARQKLLEVMESSWSENPVSEQELERARQNLLKQRELQAANSDQIAVALSDWAAQGDWRLYFLARDWLEALTVEDVQQAAQKYFTRDNRTVGLFIPADEVDRVTIPEGPDLASTLKDYQGREAIQQGEAFDPDPLAIEQRIEYGDLVGGIEYALLPKKTRGNSVSMAVTVRFGTAESLKDVRGATELLGWLMSRGTEDMDYTALQDELTRLRANLSINSVPTLLQIRVQTKREFVPEVVDLLGKILREPRLEKDELEVIRRQVLTSLQQNQNDPNALAPRKVQQLLSPYGEDDIRYVQTIEEELEMYENVTIEQIRELHEQFLGNQGGEVVAVGDFETETVLNGFREIFEGWKSDQPYDRIDRPANPLDSQKLVTIETPDKKNAVLYSSQQYRLDDEDPEYAPLVLGNHILGSSGLASRLGNRVRQQEGLSYGVRSGLTPRAKDDRTDFTMYAITNPENRQKLLDVIMDEVNKLVDEGVTAEELSKAKEAYLQSQRVSRTQDPSLANTILGNLFNDRTMEHQAEHERQIREASLENVNAAIKKYIDPGKLAIAIAGDFGGSEED